MFVSILLLSLLGTSSAYFYFPSVDDSHSIVENFLDKMVKTIETKDSAKISDLFTDNFYFHGCKDDYDKKKIVAVLTMIPSGMNLTCKSSKFISGNKIEFIVSIAEFNPTSFSILHQEARFILSAGKLEGGNVPTCPKFHGFFGSPLHASDDAQTTVEKFLARVVSSIESKDLSIISGLFKPDFVYKMCTGTYGKTQMVVFLSKLPVGKKFSFTLHSVEDLGSSIKFSVSAIGFGEAEVVPEYVLNKNDQQLESGRNANCREMFGRRLSDVSEDSDAVIQRYLTSMKQTIASDDDIAIEKLFDDNFSFKGCKETYTKIHAVELITLVQSPFEFKLKSSNWTNMGQIECTVAITGPYGAFDAQFVYCPHRNVLKFGMITSCPAVNTVNFANF